MTVIRADGMAYGNLPASRLVTLFWFTIHAYLLAPQLPTRPLFLAVSYH